MSQMSSAGVENEKQISQANKAIGRRNFRNGMLFVAPNFLGFAFVVLIPVIFMFYTAFTKWDAFGDPVFNGVQNWVRLFKDQMFIHSFWQTLYYTVVTVPVTLVLSFATAVLLNSKLRGRTFFRTIAFFPYITAIVASAQVWAMLFDEKTGLVNQFIRLFTSGAAPGWMNDTKWAMPAVIIVAVWRGVGYNMILLLAGLQTIPGELYEAAQLDGANGWQAFWNVTVPSMRPTLFFVVLNLSIQSLRVLDLTLVMTKGGPGDSTYTLAQYVYLQAFGNGNFGYASAVSLVLFLLSLAVTLIQYAANSSQEA